MVLRQNGLSKIRLVPSFSFNTHTHTPPRPLCPFPRNAHPFSCALGLLKDDIIDDEHEVVQEAIRRLPENVQFDRMFRLKRAIQVHINRDVLPQEEWTRPENVPHPIF